VRWHQRNDQREDRQQREHRRDHREEDTDGAECARMANLPTGTRDHRACGVESFAD
jgi:hypothetical protein